MSTRNLDKLFEPKSIAVIGASNTKGSVGYILLRNLIGAEYEGIVYPVNLTAQSVQGIQAYPTISQVPRKIDLAIIAVPAKTVPDVVRECGEAGVAGAVIVSSGFKEIGADGKKLEEEVVSIAESLRPAPRSAPTASATSARPSTSTPPSPTSCPPAGRVAFFSQSGALGTAILDWATANEVGFSAFVSRRLHVRRRLRRPHRLLRRRPADQLASSSTSSRCTDARKFMSAARHFAKSKPIIVVKAGRTARRALAAA